MFDAHCGLLEGTPREAGAFTALLTATAADGERASTDVRVTVISDHDADRNGLLEIENLDQLNAIRWDLDGDGAPDAGLSENDVAAYEAAFARSSTQTRCALSQCAGYELVRDLDFDTDGDGSFWFTVQVPAGGGFTTELRLDSDDSYGAGFRADRPRRGRFSARRCAATATPFPILV